MASVPTSSYSQPPGTESLGLPYSYKIIRIPTRPAPNLAFGFVLDSECLGRWTRWYCELAYPGKLPTVAPQDVEDLLDSAKFACTRMLPGLIYHEFPNLPRLRNRVLPLVDGNVMPKHHIFVLRDDATWQGMNAPLDQELIEAVARRLGVAGQEPGWYKIDCGAH
ncbi:hypothetical protein L226DRAFT_615837 [Lentinus tigrinus ALCF2SS1-7]|uniref:uncharacterized protein n=1 Tax=Lentinus tigrinus ALCF2SS1-7 TaxID=1328758 RepID=UPI0011662DB6|nr:hypothetical protein L226DRAFT_615837 [Lentinus tigrinus ALCF2SS1-7]